MNKKKENYRSVLQEEQLTDVHSSQLNGKLDATTPTLEKDRSTVWRRVTITFTIIATSLTLTFSWQKKSKVKDSTTIPIEQVQTSPVIVNALAIDTINK